MGGPRQRGRAAIGLPHVSFLGGPWQRGWAPMLLCRMGGPWQWGWVPIGLPSHVCGAAATGLGSLWAPCFLSVTVGRGNGRAPIGLPSCFLSGLLGWMGGAGFYWALSFLGSGGSLHASFLGSWVGWLGPDNPSCFLFDFWVGWVAAACFLSGLLGRMGGPRQRGSLHVSFLVSWVRWGPRQRWAAATAGLQFNSLHVSFLTSWVGWVGAATGLGSHLAPSSCLLSGLLGRMAMGLGFHFGLPSFFLSGLLGRIGPRCAFRLWISQTRPIRPANNSGLFPRGQVKVYSVYSKAIPSGRVWSWPTACIRSPAFRFDCLSECDTFRLRKKPIWLQCSSVATILTILQLKVDSVFHKRIQLGILSRNVAVL